ncbi:MAG: sulfatase [Synechococcaceae cyanobacterium SM2_3_2]|nr:sulfatase [Synechococcaceae cyanobacterium SM2_3_2]
MSLSGSGDLVQRPNILMIVLDTQRADRLSCYGATKGTETQPIMEARPATTPHLDQFAQHSTLFERAISPAQWTIPAHASMFTGEYPSTHQVVQADLELGSDYPTMVEILKKNGYQTIGFCNNPLLGVLKNGLRRGFDTFYNYGGALPTRPANGTPLPAPLGWLLEQYTQFWRKLSYPIQNAFAKSDALFQLALHPWLAPLWTRLNFKGHTAASLRDVSRFLEQQAQKQAQKQTQPDKTPPFFCFVNLMETHLPYWPPEPFIQKFAPYFSQDRAARDFLRSYNAQPYRWMAPLTDPLSPLQLQVLSDIYDAEVAYQDHLLGQLFQTLQSTQLEDNTLVMVVADHGEGLGEHDFVGHAFVVYEELIRVPLIIHYPGQTTGERISTPVSTRRLFHTVLDVAGIQTRLSRRVQREIQHLSLRRTDPAQDPEAETVLAEAFPPHILIRAMQQRESELMEQRQCLATRRAIYQGSHKLVTTGSERQLYDMSQDPEEVEPIAGSHAATEEDRLQHLMQTLIQMAESRRSDGSGGPRQHNLEAADPDLLQQMQDLGYME